MNGAFCIAVHALVFLNHKGCSVNSEALAQNICTNSARVRKVMASLKKAGLVSTREGAEGGYLFEKDPHQVTLRQIGDALQTNYVGTAWRSGNADMECLIASGMADIMDHILLDLNRICRSRLEEITVAQIDEQIFLTREES